MKRRWCFVLVAIAGLLTTSISNAAPNAFSIGLNFASEEPEGAELGVVEGAAGVLGTENWNNFIEAVGDESGLTADNNGSAAATNVSVEWISNNTWASDGRGNEDLNEAEEDTDDRALMIGYLDTNATDPGFVTVSGLGDEFAGGYDVYVYALGGVLDRGGDYTIGNTTVEHAVRDIFEGDWIEGEEGNYMLFEGVTGSSFELEFQPQDRGNGTFRAVVNAIEIVAAGPAGPNGDFDGSGVLDVADINMLTAASAGGANPAEFDVNGDGAVNQADVNAWAKDLANTWIGDANLDGEFNSSDFVAVFTAGLFETGNAATWETGDWNGDGIFGSGDFVAAFTDGGFESGPRPPAAAQVPEPNSSMLFLLALPVLCLFRRRK